MSDFASHFLAASPNGRIESLDELLNGDKQGVYYSSQLALRNDIYECPQVAIHSFGGCVITTRALGLDGRVYPETTLGGINPALMREGHGDHQLFRNSVSTALDIISAANGTPLLSVDQCLVAMYDWDHNYQHFLVESFPRIYVASKIRGSKSIPIVVYDAPHVREITQLCFPSEQFIYCNAGTPIQAMRSALFVDPLGHNFGHISDIQAEALKHYRECCGKVEPEGGVRAPHHKTFYTRLPRAENAGVTRAMTNEAEFISAIASEGIGVAYFDGLSIAGKVDALRGVDLAISPIGANIMNFLLCYNEFDVIIINHPLLNTTEWFRDLFQKLNVPIRRWEVFNDSRIENRNEKNPVNSAYLVEAGLFTKFYRSMNP